jgi:hypothetical protein
VGGLCRPINFRRGVIPSADSDGDRTAPESLFCVVCLQHSGLAYAADIDLGAQAKALPSRAGKAGAIGEVNFDFGL